MTNSKLANNTSSRTLKNEYRHIPVMKDEIVTFLDEDNFLIGKVFIDCTLGGAGHSLEIANRLGREGLLIGIDQDSTAISVAGERLNKIDESKRPTISLVNDNFSNLDNILLQQNITGIDAILLDLGLSSYQIDTNSRGFSFKENCPLDMRMDPTKQTLNAAKIVNSYGGDDLIRVLRNFSDEKFAPQIVAEILRVRQNHEITTSDELVEIVKTAIPAPARRRGGHPAKRTFQALRIEVNRELQVLPIALDSAIRWLNPGGKIAVLSYHSLEDKIVKATFKSMEDRCVCPPDFPKCVCNKKSILKVKTKKAMLPTEAEIENNSRARSAKLRLAIKQ